ncbi:hypothetical protein Tco_1213349 [Tanacetum coccineum]
MQNQMTNLMDMLTKFMNANTASTLGSGSLPSNIVANPRGDMKSITTQSGVSYDGPQVPLPPSSLPKVVEHEPEVTKDTVQPSTKNIQPPKLCEKDDLLALKFMEIFRNLHFKLSFADALLHMPKFAPMFRKLLNNKDKIIDLIKTPVNENCSAVILKKFPEKLGDPVNLVDVIDVTYEEFAQEVLGFSNISKSGNPTPTLEPILSASPTSLTPFEGEDLLTLERLLNSDPSSTLSSEEQKFKELKTVKPSSDELPELELKDLPPHLEYAFLEGTDILPCGLISDIKRIDPKFCTHKILMEDNVKPTVQHQRRVNPKIHEVIKKEVIKLLEAGLIYPIFDSPWVSLVHCVPKKDGITVIGNDDNELIPTRLITG